MGEISTHEAFFSLKPLCDLLVREPSKENAKNVCTCLRNFPKSTLQNLMEYVLFPPIVHLGNNATSLETRLYLLSVVEAVLREVKIFKIELFFKLGGILLRQVQDAKQPTLLIAENEELKLIVMHCLKHLFLSASSDVIESIYTRNNSLRLSESFFLSLSIAKSEKYSTLRIAAIETLMTMSHIHDEADATDIVLRSQVAAIVMLYLPGIVRGMLDIAEGSDTQNHKVTLMAIRALGRVISLVMEDLPNDSSLNLLIQGVTPQEASSSSDPLGNMSKLRDKTEIQNHLESTVRSESWMRAASKKLTVPLKNLSNLSKHAHPKVRRELVTAVSLLVTKCPKNMNENIADLVDVIIVLSEDDEEEVKTQSKLCLRDINVSIISCLPMRPVTSLLEENFYKLLTKLPRMMRRSESAGQLVYLNQLTGYLRIFGKERLPKLMNSISHLRRLLLSLIYVIELDVRQVSVLDDNEITNLEDTCHLSIKSWKKFKYIQEPVHHKLIIICQLLGELGDAYIIVDSIIQLMSDMPQYQKELTLLLNWVCMTSTPNLKTLYPQVINRYIEDDVWYLAIGMHDEATLSDVQSNIVQNCLMMEGLGIIASILQQDYQPFLLKTLYLIIERAGNKNQLIRSIGLNTLQVFAESQASSNITSFLRDNVDYISYHVTVKLRRVDRNPGVLDVVTTVINYSTLDFLPCLREIVAEALGQLRVASCGDNSRSILKVLYTFIMCIRRQVCDKKIEKNNNPKENAVSTCLADKVIMALVDHKEAKRADTMIDEDCQVNENQVQAEIDNNVKAEETEETIPSYVGLVEDVIKCCLNFVPSKRIPETLMSMEILQGGLEVLSPWTDQLLPIVHQLWHPLVNRFQESNVLIMNRAWQLLYTVAQLSEDFVRSRTLDQVSPAIAKFLEISARESFEKDSKNAYKFTQMFKLQVMILSQLGGMAGYLKLQERQLWQLLDMTDKYLMELQHPILQKCCLDLYKTVFTYNGDVVWVKCLSMWNSSENRDCTTNVIPNVSGFNDEKGSHVTRGPYGRNLVTLFKYINDNVVK